MTSRLPNLLGGAALLAAFAFGFANVATAQTITVSGCTSFTTSAQNNAANINITCNTARRRRRNCANLQRRQYCHRRCDFLTFSAILHAGYESHHVGHPEWDKPVRRRGACTSPYPVNIPGLPVPVSTTNYTVTASDGSLQVPPRRRTLSAAAAAAAAST